MNSAKGRHYEIEILEPAEVQAMLDKCEEAIRLDRGSWTSRRRAQGRIRTGYRDRALIALLYRAGLRVSEALHLRPRDITTTGAVTVHHGKGDKRRVVGVDPRTLEYVRAWIEFKLTWMAHYQHPPTIHDYVFASMDVKGAALNQSSVERMVKRRALEVGIAKRVHPHGFRHTMASELAAEGTNLRLIQAQLGHSSISTTARYIARINPAEVVSAMAERRWAPPAPRQANSGTLVGVVEQTREPASASHPALGSGGSQGS